MFLKIHATSQRRHSARQTCPRLYFSLCAGFILALVAGLLITQGSHAQDTKCQFTLSDTFIAFPHEGGIGKVSFEPNMKDCAWEASTKDDFITILTKASGNGPGVIAYEVAPSSDESTRKGAISVAGQTLTIVQGDLTQISAPQRSLNAQSPNPPIPESNENVILQWNRVLQETVRTPGQQPPTIFPVRSFAMMHAAMFDAVNSIDGAYTPYLTDVPGFQQASQEAAAAQAAHDVLAALYPTRLAVFDAELAVSLTGIPRTQAKLGRKVGFIVAERLLAHRANDGWNVTPPPYVLPTTPGNWQPTPPNFPTAGFTQFPAVLPFAIGSSSRFAPNPPPAMTSDEYARDFNEVKELGSATSTTRTADQTKVAQLWANVNTPTTNTLVWNNVARTVAIERNNTTAENARLFALLNIAQHDALQTSMTSKFVYGLWRPVTAIRRADEDGNPNTAPDVNWSSLIINPPYPSYAGNMATIGTSQATILALFFGRDDIRYQHTWDGAGGATRSYPGFNAMANEQERARVYGGIHFTFDQVAGQSAGRNVGNFVFLNFMKPRCNN